MTPAHIVESRIYFGAPDGSEGMYTPITSSVKLYTITTPRRRTAARTVAKFGQAWAGVPAKSASMITPIQITLRILQTFQGAVQDLIDQIEQYIGGSNADQPKDLWYIDDALETVETVNAESIGSNVSVEYTGTEFFSAGDYLFYPGGDPANNDEVVVVESVQDSADLFIADLQSDHAAEQSLFKIQFCYPKARLDSIIPSPSTTGRTRVVLNLTSEGEPLSGSSLPS